MRRKSPNRYLIWTLLGLTALTYLLTRNDQKVDTASDEPLAANAKTQKKPTTQTSAVVATAPRPEREPAALPQAQDPVPPLDEVPALPPKMATQHGDQRWDEYPVIAKEEYTDSDGQSVKAKLVKSDMHFPLVLVEERGGKKSQTLAMVGDHVMISLADKHTEEELVELAQSLGGQIRKHLPNSPVYLVSFEASDVRKLKQMVDAFKQSPIVRIAEPDYIVHL